MTEQCKECYQDIESHEDMDSGLCRDCWLTTAHNETHGLEDVIGGDVENFFESGDR